MICLQKDCHLINYFNILFSMSAETARRADSVLEVILLRCGLLYLSRFALLLLLLLLLFITPKRQHSKTQAIQEIHKHNT